MNTTSTIAIVGSGMIGSALTRLAATAGYRVLLANSRGAETLTEFASSIGDSVKPSSVDDAVNGADLIVLAVPLAAFSDFPQTLFAGKIVVDTTNYYPDRFGPLPEVDASGLPSSAFLQARWPAARIVKAFNTLDYLRLERLANTPSGVTTAIPLASNDEDACATVAQFVAALGYEPLNAGKLEESWRFEPGSPLHVRAYMRADPNIVDPYEQFSSAQSIPVGPARTTELLAAATPPNKDGN